MERVPPNLTISQRAATFDLGLTQGTADTGPAENFMSVSGYVLPGNRLNPTSPVHYGLRFRPSVHG